MAILNLNTLAALQLQAELASASYEDGTRPGGFKDVNLEKLGVDPGDIDGAFFENDDAAARVMKRDGDFYIAFRGTDSFDDVFDYTDIDDGYIDKFDKLLVEIADDINGDVFVTGHSLGAAAVHQLYGDAGDFGNVYQTASYFSFGSPIFNDSEGLQVFGYANDAIYGIDEDGQPPQVGNLFWYTPENGVEQKDATSEDNEAAHSIDNMAEGLERLQAADVLKSSFGLVGKRGLDLDVNTIISGTHGELVMPSSDDLPGKMVVIGVDGRLADESKSEIDRSDVIIGRNLKNATDWIDGMRGNDEISGRAGDDRLIGGLGADTIEGGKGADILYGGADRDQLSGGKGADVFVFADRQGEPDVILDFSGGKGDVVRIDADVFGGNARDDLTIVNADRDPAPDGKGETVLYAGESGRLFYDPDGTGSKDATLIAILKDGPARLQGDDVTLV